MATWTDATARLHAKGAIAYAKGNRLAVEDVYQVTMANGARPLGYDIRYRYRTGDAGATASGTLPKNVTGIPARGAEHGDYPCFKAVAIDWSQPDPRSRVWECRVRYEYDPAGASSVTLDDDVVSISFSSVSIQTPITTGEDGAALRNSAGDPFDPVPMAEISCPVVDVVLNSSTSPASMQQWQGAINSDAVTIAGIRFPKWCARLTWTARRLEDGEEEGEGGASHVGERYQYTFHVEGNFSLKPREDEEEGSGSPRSSGSAPEYAGWVQYIPDMGWNHLNGDGAKVANTVRLQDDDGEAEQPNPQQQYLDSDGKIKTEGFPRYVRAFPYPVADFDGLNLPEDA